LNYYHYSITINFLHPPTAEIEVPHNWRQR